MPRDRSPALPETISATFGTMPCGTATYTTIPGSFAQTASLADAGLDISEAGYSGSLTIIDTAHAVYTTSTATSPANAATLQTLTDQIAKDWWAWRLDAFDLEYGTIAAPVLDASVDSIRWTYRRDQCNTRLTSAPWDSHSEQLNHDDPADDCVIRLPVYLSSPVASVTSGVLKLQIGQIWVENGLLKWATNGTTSITLCPG